MKPNELSRKDLMEGDWVYGIFSGCPQERITMKYSICSNSYEWKYMPIPLTAEILEKNGFERDAFTNLSPDFFYEDDACSISINLNSTCDKCKSIWVKNRNLRITASIEESRHSLQKKPLLLHQLQHALRLCGIEKEIIL